LFKLPPGDSVESAIDSAKVGAGSHDAGVVGNTGEFKNNLKILITKLLTMNL
jgi:hypothetical protein